MNPYALQTIPMLTASTETRHGAQQRGGVVASVKTLTELAGGAWLASAMSAKFGGPGGQKLFGMPVELVGAIGCGLVAGGLAATGSGLAKYSGDILAIGVGSAIGYAGRDGFNRGLKHAAPPGVGYMPPYAPTASIGAPGGGDNIQQAEQVLDHLVAR